MSDCLTNPRHEAFAQSLAKGLTADAAYAEAGYRPNRGNAVRLKANESVQRRVAELVAAGAKVAEVDIAKVLAELKRIAFGGLSAFLRISADGELLIDLSRVSKEDLDTLDILECDIVEKDNQVTHRRIKIRRLDKLTALAALARHLGLGKAQPPAATDAFAQGIKEINERGSVQPIGEERQSNPMCCLEVPAARLARH